MTVSETSRPLAKATYREWVGLAVIALPCIVYAMDLTILNLAVPSLSADLKPSAAQLLWIVDIYGFLTAGALPIMGTLGDRIGRRKLLLTGATCFATLSLIAAFSRTPGMLIAVRALLGVAGATMAPSTLSLISNMFSDDREKTFAVSVWVASFSLGGAIGPAIGGIILAHFWWGAVFLAPVPGMAILHTGRRGGARVDGGRSSRILGCSAGRLFGGGSHRPVGGGRRRGEVPGRQGARITSSLTNRDLPTIQSDISGRTKTVRDLEDPLSVCERQQVEQLPDVSRFHGRRIPCASRLAASVLSR